jgi:iron complex outermembrane receptor protein
MDAKIYYSYIDHIITDTRRPSFMMTEVISTIDTVTEGGKVDLKLKPSEKLAL